MASGAVGERIAAYRRRRGLSQAALAGLVGRSESWLSQVERGVRSVDRLSVLLDLARVLHVDVESLSGRPWQYAPNGGAFGTGLAELRTCMTRYDHMLGDSTPAALTLAQLQAQVVGVHRNYQAAHYEQVISGLPELLGQAERLRLELAQTPDQREGHLVYVSAYAAAAKLVTKLGSADLAILAADRAAAAAYTAESDVASGMAAYQVACAVLRAEQPQDAEHLAVGMAEKLERTARSDSPIVVSLCGALWLIAAVIAARQTEKWTAWERIERAQRLATCWVRTATTRGRHSGQPTWRYIGSRSRPSSAIRPKRCALPPPSTPSDFRRVWQAGGPKCSWTWLGPRLNGSAMLKRPCICWMPSGWRQRSSGTTSSPRNSCGRCSREERRRRHGH